MLALVSGFGLLARFACVTLLDITPISDFASYLQLASNLYDGEGLRDNRHGAYAFYSAGYSLYMYLIFLVAGKSINTVQIFNALLGLCAILMVYSIGASIARSRWVGIVAALAWALYLPAILYTEYLAKENLMTLVLLAHVRLMVALPNSKNPNVLSALFGLLAGVQAVVGPAALAIVPVFFNPTVVERRWLSKVNFTCFYCACYRLSDSLTMALSQLLIVWFAGAFHQRS